MRKLVSEHQIPRPFRFYVGIALMLLFAVQVSAQTRTNKGKVISATDKQIVSGEKVLMKGSYSGTFGNAGPLYTVEPESNISRSH